MAKKKLSEGINNASDEAKWLIAKYNPTALFSLRMTHSTSSGGKTLFIPTPYAFKLALVDAAYRAGGHELAKQLFDWIKGSDVRFCPPQHLTVNHTFIKIKREPKQATPEKPYISSIAFREYCYFRGQLKIALSVNSLSEEVIAKIQFIMAHINYLGKRGSFMQFSGCECAAEIPTGFTLRVPEDLDLTDINIYKVAQFLDDIGEIEAKDLFERINTYLPSKKIDLNKHRVFKQNLLPYTVQCSSKGYTYYKTPFL